MMMMMMMMMMMTMIISHCEYCHVFINLDWIFVFINATATVIPCRYVFKREKRD